VLNTHTFPVKYADQFYKELVKEEEKDIIKLAYHTDILVGAVCCRIERKETKEPEPAPAKDVKGKGPKKQTKAQEAAPAAPAPPVSKRLYIMTLGVLAPYRKYGIGGKMLKEMIKFVEKRPDIDEITLHVQVGNNTAIKFYESNGFEIVDTIKNYYQRITPADCHLVRRSFLKAKSEATKD